MDWMMLSAFADEAGESTQEQVVACKNAGIKYIDPRNVDGYNISELPLEIARKVAKQYHSDNVNVHMYGSPIGKIDITDDFQIDLDRLRHLGRLRYIFGANRVRIFSYYNKTGRSKSEWRNVSIDRLKRLRDLAAQTDLVLYHENESEIFGDHPEDVADIAELCDGTTFKLIYDFANYLRTGVTPQETWAMFRNKTDCFHLKDQRWDGQHVLIGRGDTQAIEILQDACANGWVGPCVLEPHLTHSKAVLATGVHGQGDASMDTMSPAESFNIAAGTAIQILKAISKPLATEY